jgi:WD40 repeat protein
MLSQVLLIELHVYLICSLFCIIAYWYQAVHTAPVASMAFDKTSTLLATGGADASIKVWDVVRQYCTNNLRGHSGVVRYSQLKSYAKIYTYSITAFERIYRQTESIVVE